MSDRRLTPANGRVAADSLRGAVEAESYVEGAARQLCAPVADLMHAPRGRRERQVVSGEHVTVFEDRDGWSFVQLARDGYVGYLPSSTLTDPEAATHWVHARSTHLYPAPDFKAREIHTLSHLSRVHVIQETGRFAQVSGGFIPRMHLAPLDALASDPVTVAQTYLATPYLWGGNSAFGIDCSGLVQAGCLACGIPCPGDSDLQEAGLGQDLPEDAPLRRGDLLFWKGHVAWVADADTILHANAHHMAVTFEPMHDAITRIAEQGDGPVTARKRLGGHL